MESQRFCRECERPLSGRRDKKFCNEYCKSAFHYKKNRKGNNFYLQVAQQLKMNRKLLKAYNKAGKATVRAEILLAQGFQPKFFTHYWKTRAGDVYLFVYEYGFLSRLENGKKKYVLVTWQPYMEKA